MVASGSPGVFRIDLDRQVLWLGEKTQRELSRLHAGVVGLGGIGSLVTLELALLGLEELVLVDDDRVDETNRNRLLTVTSRDTGRGKADVTREALSRIHDDLRVLTISEPVTSPSATDALKGVDVLFGCVDNDGARLVLNELALAYSIPYFDLATGIIRPENAWVAGGRVCLVRPGGPCLQCMGQIDPEEARLALASAEKREWARARGYVEGLDVPAPSVAPLNTAVVGMALSKFLLYVSGSRTVAPCVEYDLLSRASSQRIRPRLFRPDSSCCGCPKAGRADEVDIERFHRSHLTTLS